MVQSIYRILHAKKNRSKNKWCQTWKSIVQIMNNVPYDKTRENLRNRNDVKFVNNENNY